MLSHPAGQEGPPGKDWVALVTEVLPLDRATSWVVQPDCGALVVFAGTVRDHAEGRPGVSSLEYEAYTDVAGQRLESIVAELRQRWPATGRVALLHRFGVLAVSDVSVVVALSAPHRAEAFEAARFAIDTLKATVPIWKRETWSGGSDWVLDVHPLDEVSS